MNQDDAIMLLAIGIGAIILGLIARKPQPKAATVKKFEPCGCTECVTNTAIIDALWSRPSREPDAKQ